MEGLGDQSFRYAMSQVGGFDWACTEFIRVPTNAHIPSLCKVYFSNQTAPIPQAAQIMGSNPALMAEMAAALQMRGAPRIDLNCGCPSNTVTGRGAGSSLLKTPDLLYKIASEMVKAVSIPVSVKLRSGFSDTSLFKENLLAAQEAKISFLTLHPRTKEDGYGPPARWELIAEAKQFLQIPVVGNGDIITADDAMRMKQQTGCDGLMIGRAAAMNPWIFHEIRACFMNTTYEKPMDPLDGYFSAYIRAMDPESTSQVRIGKLKQMASFLFRASEKLAVRRTDVLRRTYVNELDFLSFVLPLYRELTR